VKTTTHIAVGILYISILMLYCSDESGADPYVTRFLQVPQGYLGGGGLAVNDSGFVVGSLGKAGPRGEDAFVWGLDGVPKKLWTLGAAIDISNSGYITGYSEYAGPIYKLHAMGARLDGGSYDPYPPYIDFNQTSQAVAVNDSGIAVGNSSDNGSAGRPYISGLYGTNAWLPIGAVCDISDNGVICSVEGRQLTTIAPDGTILRPDSNGQKVVTAHINSFGTIAGVWSTSYGYSSYIWSPQAGFSSNCLPAGFDGRIEGISDTGVMIGSLHPITTGEASYSGFAAWNSKGTILLTTQNTPLYGISNNGTITGSVNGVPVVWEPAVVVPEPAGVYSLGIGLPLFTLLSRRKKA